MSQWTGRLHAKKLPADDVAIVQQLAVWLPNDARLLWLLAELANAHGDVRTAAAIMDGVVTEFALTTREARERRQRYRSAADEIAKLPDSEHAKYRGDIVFKSPRAVGRTLDSAALPAIRPDGVNPLPWAVLAETVVDKPFRPKFHKHLQQLDGKTVSLTGFMQPVSMDPTVTGFMLIEYPIGCWFCETPEPAGIIYVEIAGGKAVPVKRGRVKVEGTLKLNTTRPRRLPVHRDRGQRPRPGLTRSSSAECGAMAGRCSRRSAPSSNGRAYMRVAVVVSWCWCRSQKVNPKANGWHSDYATAKAEAKRTGKPLFVAFRCEP